MIQTTSLESRTEKSLRNPENLTNKNFTPSDAYVTNNYRKLVICPNKLMKSLYKNRHFTENKSATHKDTQLYKNYRKLDLITIFSLRPLELMTIVDMVRK